MRRMFPALLLILLVPFHILGLQYVTREWKSLPVSQDAAYVIPSPILKITSLEYKGIASDFLFLRALVFFGGIIEKVGLENKPLREVSMEWEWKWLYDTLKASTDLDPYFYDPYYFGQAHLPWMNMTRETNILLENGVVHRDWDWNLPFFKGFNYFYFLQENDKASEYLMIASRKPGASPLFASLAVRLAYRGRRTANAISFIEQILKNEEDESIKKEYHARLETLKAILYLEQVTSLYIERFGNTPSDLKTLIEKGLIKALPKDPYGGEFYISFDGSIKTTSDMRYKMN